MFPFHQTTAAGGKGGQQKKTSKKSSSCCCWLFGSFALFAIIVGLLAYDTHTHGGVFAKSATGKYLHQVGALPYVDAAWTKSMSTGARGFQWAEKHVPVYVNCTYTTLKPYALLVVDVAIVGGNVVRDCIRQKGPIVVNFVS